LNLIIENAKYMPFSYRPTLEDDCMDDEQEIETRLDMEDENEDGEEEWTVHEDGEEERERKQNRIV